HDRTVSLIRKVVPDVVELVYRTQDFFDRFSDPPAFTYRQSQLLEQWKNLRVKIDIYSFDRARAVEHDAQRAFGHDGWVKLFERSGRGVAWISEQRKSGLFSFRIQLREAVLIHVNFTAHFENFWRGGPQSLGNGTDRFDILCDVVAHRSISAGRRLP